MEVDAARELIVLGVLRRSALSAYSVERAVRHHAPLYRPFKRGNIYHFVSRLARGGLLESQSAQTQRGPQESKDIFALSPAGETRFKELLRSVLRDAQAGDPALEIALVLLGQLERDVALTLLAERRNALEEHGRRVRRLLGDVQERGGSAYLSACHQFARLKSEDAFLREAMALLRDKKWSPHWQSNDGAIRDLSKTL
jgi:DNA-binding PadR family transcriptional regulator